MRFCPLPRPAVVRIVAHMGRDEIEARYVEALDHVNLTELARATGRSRRALTAYRSGERRVTVEAARELVAYLANRADTFIAAANALAAVVEEGTEDG